MWEACHIAQPAGLNHHEPQDDRKCLSSFSLLIIRLRPAKIEDMDGRVVVVVARSCRAEHVGVGLVLECVLLSWGRGRAWA